ncbi:hypothetical protein MML48_2g00015293 [Holotrichia oblita]|uniref:Uncharacterized protein n=1 Tax=Holotrichia oblita TaxID=644536 RepID=A0ACB9TM72_HOLOL|nr:hypothetical protein MML48_2g00015293 [Holotrichia oblita]
MLVRTYENAEISKDSYEEFSEAIRWIQPNEQCDSIAGGAVCINIERCTVLYKYILQENLPTDEAKEAISKFICNKKQKKVCCPAIVPEFITSNLVVNHMEHRNYKLLPENCGSGATAEKIINGNETELFEFPWAVALKYDTGSTPWKCGASLISERYVLTAAHCIKSDLKLTTVRLGEHNFDKEPDCEQKGPVLVQCADTPQDFEVSENDAIVHPDYNSETYDNDIALIRLRKPANISSDDFSPILLKVTVPTVTNVECASKYATRRQVSKNHLCAGGKNTRDTCRGDSGSPLMAEYTLDDRFRTLQYGIVSLGASVCGFEGFPTLYTRVARYVGWILDNMQP